MNLVYVFIMLVAAMPILAWAQSRAAGSPFDFSLLATYGWVFVISFFGGFASWARKVKDGKARWFNFVELIGELAIASFAGVITFLLCRWAETNEWLMAALIGISGHMGSRTIFLAEQALERWYRRMFPSVGGDDGTGSKEG